MGKLSSLSINSNPALTDEVVTVHSPGGSPQDVDVPINKIAAGNPVWGYLGSASITSNPTTTSSTAVQITGLSTTVTVPTGYTEVRITVYLQDLYSSASATIKIQVWRGVVGSGTQIGGALFNNGGSVNNAPSESVIALDAPGAGTYTYNIGWLTSAGTAQIDAAAGTPALMIVECC
jgi:hypothetical protein